MQMTRFRRIFRLLAALIIGENTLPLGPNHGSLKVDGFLAFQAPSHPPEVDQ
jgi:hypothetical protein